MTAQLAHTGSWIDASYAYGPIDSVSVMHNYPLVLISVLPAIRYRIAISDNEELSDNEFGIAVHDPFLPREPENSVGLYGDDSRCCPWVAPITTGRIRFDVYDSYLSPWEALHGAANSSHPITSIDCCHTLLALPISSLCRNQDPRENSCQSEGDD